MWEGRHVEIAKDPNYQWTSTRSLLDGVTATQYDSHMGCFSIKCSVRLPGPVFLETALNVSMGRSGDNPTLKFLTSSADL